ncbi:MAG: hypothetical protein ACQEUZ_07420 [Pseudomonadota bacterium]
MSMMAHLREDYWRNRVTAGERPADDGERLEFLLWGASGDGASERELEFLAELKDRPELWADDWRQTQLRNPLQAEFLRSICERTWAEHVAGRAGR